MPRRIAHVGLAKTATTSLQRTVLPAFAEHLGIPYLDCLSERVRRLNAELLVRHATTANPDAFPDRFLLSCEGLSSWDPHWWEAHAEALETALGSTTHVVLTLREPRSWMASLFVQRCVHEGNVMRPDQFFLEREAYSAYLSTPKFDVAAFRYTRLVDAYRSRFERVTVVPYESMADLSFLHDLDEGSPFDVEEARRDFASVRENRSYSRRAVAVTVGLERALKHLGLGLSHSWHGASLSAVDLLRAREASGASGDGAKRTRSLGRRAVTRALRALNWPRLVQGGLDRMLPYSRYELDFSTLPWVPIELLEADYVEASGRDLPRRTCGDAGAP